MTILLSITISSISYPKLTCLVESYLMLGLNVEAKKYAAVLGHNYPNSNWYKYCQPFINNFPKGPNKTPSQ
ncbi:hypothetical protein [Candidatus Tisiphia endosymbiont of Ditula angustiorana]|uniref:hypothetical protein n=1 Tax=Candidatus Tisiphia endosymbiont of Ditula angustiorana TaxID=3066272 RepID=UPI00312C8BCB